MACIYRILNVVTDDVYYGSAVNPKRRRWEHWNSLRKGEHHCKDLQAAWGVFGEDAFEFEILEEVDEAEMIRIEDIYLAQHAGQAHCYNTALTSQSPASSTASVRDKISASLKEIYKDKTQHPRYGHTHSEETKAKIAASRKGKQAGAEHYRWGKTLSAEVRGKISAAQKSKPKASGRTLSEEGRRKVRANIEAGRSHKHWLGRTHSAETKTLLSCAVTAVDPAGVTHPYPSITALREAIGLKPSTVNRALKSGHPLSKGPFKGWSFRYTVYLPS